MAVLAISHGRSQTYPASILGTGGTGTSLAAVYDLQKSGATGPRSTPTKQLMSDASTIVPELATQGCSLQSNGSDYFFIPSGTALSGFDCTLGAFATSGRQFIYDGTGADAVWTDCKMNNPVPGGVVGMSVVGTLSGNRFDNSSTMGVQFNYCDMGYHAVQVYAGHANLYKSWLHDAQDGYCSTNGNAGQTAQGAITWDSCYITAGGLNLGAVHTHIEMIFHGSDGLFTCTNTLIDLTNGASYWPYTDSATGWTAVLFCNAANTTQTNHINNSIVIGLRANNAGGHSKIGEVIAYGNGGGPQIQIQNCVMDPGVFGYSLNGSGGNNPPTDLGGNRDFLNNTAITFT